MSPPVCLHKQDGPSPQRFSSMALPRQRTLARPAEICGFGLFRGGDCRLRFLPAPEDFGIAFRRVDLPGRPLIPATIDSLVPAERRTVIASAGAKVEMIEHVMAAVAGLWIDNCLIELDAIEPPVGDGSSIAFVEALQQAGFIEQSAPAAVVHAIDACAGSCLRGVEMSAAPRCIMGYHLDYPGTIVGRQSVEATITPETFVKEFAFARTFVMADEIAALQAQGLGLRATTANVLVIDKDAVRDNAFRRPDECARHKLLDSIGDFALCGARVQGRFLGHRSGHRNNHDVAGTLQKLLRSQTCPIPSGESSRTAA